MASPYGSLRRGLHELRVEPQLRWALRARLLRPYRERQFAAYGAGTIVHKPDWVYGPQKIAVGSYSVLLHGLWLSVERPAWDREGLAISIGDRVGVRPYCTVSATESVVIEDGVTLSSFTSVIDSDHRFGEASSVVDEASVSSPIRIGARSWIGERVAVLRGSNIGVECAIGANSVVRGDIPDYSVAVGAPARVVGSTREGPLSARSLDALDG